MEFDVFTLKFNDSGDGLGLKLANDDLDCSINLENERLVDFKLENHTDKQLFQSVAEDLIKQINAEIKDSAKNFEEIIAFKSQTN